MARIPETQQMTQSSSDTLVSVPSDSQHHGEERGRQQQVLMRHEFVNAGLNTKNIQFKGTVGYSANELLRSRSQMSRNSSTHSVQPRHESMGNLLAVNGYPNTKSLLSAYNDKAATDTVLPSRHQKQYVHHTQPATSAHGSRASSVHSARRNYTFRSESQSRVRDRQESLVEFLDTADAFDVGSPKKSASISGPPGQYRRAHEFKRSYLNHSYNASGSSLDDDDSAEDKHEAADPFLPMGSLKNVDYDSPDNLFPKHTGESTSPKTRVELEVHAGAADDSVSEKANVFHERAMRTLNRQMNIRDQVINVGKSGEETDEFSRKWNSFVSVDDRRMFEMITNDLKKVTGHNRRPVMDSLARCVTHGHLRELHNGTSGSTGSFDLATGRDQVKRYWKELNSGPQEPQN